MRDSTAPPLLRFLFVVAVIEYCGGEGAGDGEEDKPIPRGELGSQSRETFNTHQPGTKAEKDLYLPIIRRAGFPPGLTCSIAAVGSFAAAAADLVSSAMAAGFQKWPKLAT